MTNRTIMPSSYEERIEILFDKKERKPNEIRSSLTLLMSEAERNFTNKPNSIWSGVMCVMSGIDLVAKFYADSDISKVGERFENYLINLMGLSPEDAKLVYHARCAYMHSFSLYSEDYKTNEKYFVHPRFENWQFIVRKTKCDGKTVHFELCIDTLYRTFEESLERLRENMLTSERKNFSDLFDKYGTDKPLFMGPNFYDYCNFKK